MNAGAASPVGSGGLKFLSLPPAAKALQSGFSWIFNIAGLSDIFSHSLAIVRLPWNAFQEKRKNFNALRETRLRKKGQA
jgi:hypothetical protein